MEEQRIVRETERRQITGVPRATWYRYERLGEVPKKVPLLGRTVGWRLEDLLKWNRERRKLADDISGGQETR